MMLLKKYCRAAPLRMAEKKYRDLIETLPVAVFTVDTEGYIDLYNQAAVNLWKRKPVKRQDKWFGAHGLFTVDKSLEPKQDDSMASQCTKTGT